MMEPIIDGVSPHVNTSSKTLENLRARYLPSGSGPSHQAKVETLLSGDTLAAKIISLASLIITDAGGQPLFSRPELEVILSSSSRKFITKSSSEFAASALGEVVKGVGRRPSEYRSTIMSRILQTAVADPSWGNIQSSDGGPQIADPTVGPQSDRSGPHGGSATIGLGGEGEGVVVVDPELSSPKDGCGSGRELATTTNHGEPYSNHINPDITAREYIGVGASEQGSVVVNCETIKGPGFVISIRAAEVLAGTLGMPVGRGKDLAEIEAHSWAAQGFTPGQPDKVVASAIRKHVSQIAQVKAQVAAVSEPSAGAQKWGSLMASSGKPIDRSNSKGYTEPTKAENDDFWANLSAKIKEKENAKSNGPLPEAPKAIL